MLATTPRTGAIRIGQLAGLSLVVFYVLAVQWAARPDKYALWSALIFIPLLILITFHLIARAARVLQDEYIVRLLIFAFILKALATVARYMMAFVLYDGSADAALYHIEGERLATSYRHGDFDADLGHEFIGTGFIRALTGALYTLTGPSLYVAFAFYAWLGFWGLYFFYRAFRVALPDADHRRYALLVLLLPSMLFWPSALGKEAVMTFGIGLAAFGAARVMSGHPKWLFPLVLGLTVTAVVRPHITAVLFAGFAVAIVFRRSMRPGTPLTPLARGLAIAAVIAVGFLLVNRAAQFMDVDDLTLSGVEEAVHGTEDRTSIGGSEFEANPVNSPLDMPWATVSVLFRPFLFEVANAQALIAAVEGAVLLVLVGLSIPRLRTVVGDLRSRPYLIVALVYILLFVYAFSNFSNFGILTRQRVQVLPFVLVFLALPRRSVRPTPSDPRTAREELVQ